MASIVVLYGASFDETFDATLGETLGAVCFLRFFSITASFFCHTALLFSTARC